MTSKTSSTLSLPRIYKWRKFEVFEEKNSGKKEKNMKGKSRNQKEWTHTPETMFEEDWKTEAGFVWGWKEKS